MQTFLYSQGTRVRIRRGQFPMDPALSGRSGLIVEYDDYRPQRYGVVLDGEEDVRDFAEDELEPLEAPVRREGDPGPTVGPTPSGGSSGTT
jgi:hypothetical protein